MGEIAIEGMLFYAHHGYYREEQVIGGQYKVDVYMQTDFQQAAMLDKLEMTIDYEKIYTIVKEVMTEKSHLIEHVALRIIEKVTAENLNISSIKVRVSKINPPVKGTVNRVFVELEKQVNNGNG